MDFLVRWLPEHLPEEGPTVLVHGDFRIANMFFHPDRPEVAAMSDWEISTLGDSIADLSYQAMSWHLPPQALAHGLGGLDLPALGIPTGLEYVAMYQAAGGSSAAEHWDFFITYNLFGLAAIVYGIRGRVDAGTAATADAARLASQAERVTAMARVRAVAAERR